MTIEQAFGNAIRRLRKERNLSQEALAASSRLDRTFISLIECGKKNPTLITIFQLASGLNISSEKILSEVETIMVVNGANASGKLFAGGGEVSSPVLDSRTFTEFMAQNGVTGSETILLVEDDVDARDFIAMLLRQVGYRVILAENGDEAVSLHAAWQEEIGLIVMDVVIPACNGIEAANRIRASHPASKVVFISGYEPECLKIAPDRFPFIRKPLDPLHFVTTIRSLLEA